MTDARRFYGAVDRPLVFTTVEVKAISENGDDVMVETERGWLTIGIAYTDPDRKRVLRQLQMGERARMALATDDPTTVTAVGYRHPRVSTVTRSLVGAFCDIDQDTVDDWVLQATPWRARDMPPPPVMPAIVNIFEGTMLAEFREGVRGESGYDLTIMASTAMIDVMPETLASQLGGRPFDEIVDTPLTRGLGLVIDRATVTDDRTCIVLRSETLDLVDRDMG